MASKENAPCTPNACKSMGMDVTSSMPQSRLPILITANVASFDLRSAAVAYTTAMTAPPLAPQMILNTISQAWLCSCVLARLPAARISKATSAKRRRSTRAMNRAQTPQAMAIAINSAAKIAPMALSGSPS